MNQVDTGNRATTGKVGQLGSEAGIRRQKRVSCGTLEVSDHRGKGEASPVVAC